MAAMPPCWPSSPPSTTAAAAAPVVGIRGSSVPGHLDPQLPPIEERAVHGVHRVLGVPFVVEAHKRESAALLRVAVPGDVHVPDPAVLLEHASQGLGRGSVR